jgi:hypothetical protein
LVVAGLACPTTSSLRPTSTYRRLVPAISDLDLERIKRFCAEESPAKVADQVRVVEVVVDELGGS